MARARDKKGAAKGTVWTEFDCPECGAENPWDDGFEAGEELFCAWCGAVLIVKLVRDSDPPRYRLEVE